MALGKSYRVKPFKTDRASTFPYSVAARSIFHDKSAFPSFSTARDVQPNTWNANALTASPIGPFHSETAKILSDISTEGSPRFQLSSSNVWRETPVHEQHAVACATEKTRNCKDLEFWDCSAVSELATEQTQQNAYFKGYRRNCPSLNSTGLKLNTVDVEHAILNAEKEDKPFSSSD